MIKNKKVTLESLGERIGAVDEKVEALGGHMDRLDETYRKQNVLLEKMHKMMDLVVVGFSSVSKRMDKVEDRVGMLERHG
jgi:hypothetical protein